MGLWRPQLPEVFRWLTERFDSGGVGAAGARGTEETEGAEGGTGGPADAGGAVGAGRVRALFLTNRRAAVPRTRSPPVEPHREQAQHEGRDDGETAGERGERVEADAEHHHRGADHRRDRVEVTVPAQQGGDLVGEDVTQHTAAHGGREAEGGGGGQAEPVVVRLDGAGDTEQSEPGRVEDVHADLDAFHLRVQEEHDQGGDERCGEVPQVGEGRRGYGADDDVAQQPSAQRGDLREDGYAEDVEVLADGQQGAGDREDEDADQVERVLDGGLNRCWNTPTFSPVAGCAPYEGRSGGPTRPYEGRSRRPACLW